MSTAWSPPRTAAELPDDDHEAAYMITGGLYDGCEIDRRRRKLWPQRNGSPSVKRDPEMTARWKAAVLEHDKNLDQIMADIASGKLKLEDISEDDVVAGLHALALDKRRPAVQLASWKALAEMKGMLKNAERAHVSMSDDAIEEMLEEAATARNGIELAARADTQPPGGVGVPGG